MSFLTWVSESLRQVLREQPTLLLAPALVCTPAPFWKKPDESQQETNANASTPFTRKQRRRFTKLLRTSLLAKPQRKTQHRKGTQRLRTHRSPYATNAFNKGELGTSSRRSQTQRKKPARRPKYHPVPADGAPDAFVPAPWTTQQRNAANKIISHVNLACTATLRIALQAPARMRNAIGSATNSAPIIWDSGASISISPDPEDFQGETIQVESNRLTLSGVPGDSCRGAVMVLVNLQNNLPTSDAFNGQDPFKATDALVATITVVHETNHNLSEAEKELLRWHYRLGHIGFKKIQFLLRTGVLSQTEASRLLHSAACKLTNLPKCAACQYGKQHRRPIPGSTPSTIIRDRTNILKADNVIPGHRISVDHFICSTRGHLVLTSAGKTKADNMYTEGLHLRGPRLRFRPCRTPSQSQHTRDPQSEREI
ncbi:hypothetical protein MHU86_25626 [Fragilaria crotonensis]|nr:hypothetical protein MHU86_25626 [Fragilaria crotonensis]